MDLRDRRADTKLDEETTVIPAENGQSIVGEANSIAIDGTMRISSDDPLRVRYLASTGPTCGRATDFLHLNYAESKTAYQAGATISRYIATIHVVASPWSQMEAVAFRVKNAMLRLCATAYLLAVPRCRHCQRVGSGTRVGSGIRELPSVSKRNVFSPIFYFPSEGIGNPG